MHTVNIHEAKTHLSAILKRVETGEYIADKGHDLLLSSASCWEIAIKAKMGRLKLSENPEKFILDQMILNNIPGLPIQLVHALHVYNLPYHHRNPFEKSP